MDDAMSLLFILDMCFPTMMVNKQPSYRNIQYKKRDTTPAGIYLLKVNNRSTRIRCEICSKLIIKTPERRHWRRSGVFIVNFEHVHADWAQDNKHVDIPFCIYQNGNEQRVTVANPETGVKLTGDEGPLESELEEWMSKNPG